MWSALYCLPSFYYEAIAKVVIKNLVDLYQSVKSKLWDLNQGHMGREEAIYSSRYNSVLLVVIRFPTPVFSSSPFKMLTIQEA